MKARLVIISLVALAVTTGLLAIAPSARAGEVGYNYPAEVHCNSATNTISVRPRFGAGDSYNEQWLSYRFWARNDNTGIVFWLSSGGAWSPSFLHKRVGEPYKNELGDWFPGMISPFAPIGWSNFTRTGQDVAGHFNQFSVYAQYAWYSPRNGWLTSSTYTTTSYSNEFQGTMGYCAL